MSASKTLASEIETTVKSYYQTVIECSDRLRSFPQDIYVIDGDGSNQLLMNNRKGGFFEHKIGPAVAANQPRTTGLVAVDVHGDGAPGLLAVNDDAQPNRLFISDTQGDKVEQKSGPAVTGSKNSRGAVVLDANMDGAPDLWIVNYGEPNQLLINDGKGGFVGQNVNISEAAAIGRQGVDDAASRAVAADFNGRQTSHESPRARTETYYQSPLPHNTTMTEFRGHVAQL